MVGLLSGDPISRGDFRSGDQPGVLISREATEEEETSVRDAALLSMWRRLPGGRGDESVGEP